MFQRVRALLLTFCCLIGGAQAAQAALATDCTLYASPSGKDTNNGASPSTPKTLVGASKASMPGSVICLLGGTYNFSQTFYPYVSGTASNWIVYKKYGDSDVNLVWTAGDSAPDLNMWHFFSNDLPTGKQYIEVQGLIFDGRNNATVGIKCYKSHHLRFVGNTIKNMGATGIGSKYCDYLTADGNHLIHNGYNQGWSSGISYNSHQWLDNAPGFHSIVANNIISGSYDGSANHTDGNGIIMDLSNNSYDYSTANTPPALIANNVVYQNGGRCIHIYVVTNIWTVNNTCYKSALDLSQSGIGEMTANNAKNSYFINNITYAWNNRQTYQQMGTTQNLVYYKNISYGGKNNFIYSDPTQFSSVDPLFVNPPPLDPTADGQYATALLPGQLANSLMLQTKSPAIDKGIDPTTLSGLTPEIVAGLKRYVLKDINGTPRPQGGGFDIGAYEFPMISPAAPSQLTCATP